MTSDPTKRLRYFNGQFLQADDFIVEQSYHIDRQRRHNRSLHTHGVAEGLSVRFVGELEPGVAEIGAGTAIDREGRQIIVTGAERIRNLSGFAKDTNVLVVISYPDPEPEDAAATVGERQNTRVLEQGRIEPIEADATGQPIDGNKFPADQYIRLALLTMGSNGSVASIDLSVQLKAGAKTGDAEFSGNALFKKVTLSNDTQNPNLFPTLSSSEANRVDLQGKFGRLFIQKDNPVTALRFDTAGAAFVWNPVAGFGLVARVTTTSTAVPGPGQPTTSGAAVAGISDRDNVNGVYATAKPQTLALLVDGKAKVTGGFDTGHLVETFINASGQRLMTGDIAKLCGTPVSRFRGLGNKAPVVEVTLADKENDPCVIGIVDCEAIPDADTPDTRVQPDDPTFIEDGGELYLVTLGAFAHCKADATDAHIEVGDLLTTSNNPGHAKKATTPKIGSIIGKALEPLKEGTGYIAVFVNIQ